MYIVACPDEGEICISNTFYLGYSEACELQRKPGESAETDRKAAG